MTDAIVDGGTANEAAVVQAAPDSEADRATIDRRSSTRAERPNNDAAPPGPEKPRPAHEFTIVHDLPDDAVSYSAGDGSRFYAPPNADFPAMYADAQAHWINPVAAFLAVGHFGRYDFQRQGDVFHSAYTDASNYAVGGYMAGAGYSNHETMTIAGSFARLYSSNAGSERQSAWWTRGWNDAKNGVGPFSRTRP